MLICLLSKPVWDGVSVTYNSLSAKKVNIIYFILPLWLTLLVFFKSMVVPCWLSMFNEVENVTESSVCLCFPELRFRLSQWRAISRLRCPPPEWEGALQGGIPTLAPQLAPDSVCERWRETLVVLGQTVSLFSAWSWRSGGGTRRITFLITFRFSLLF